MTVFTRNPCPLVIVMLFPSRATLYYYHKYGKCFSKLNSKLCRRSYYIRRVIHTVFAGAALQDLTVLADLGAHQTHPAAAIIFHRLKFIEHTELVKFVSLTIFVIES